MSSIEGMWKFQSGSVLDPKKPVWGGIVVLESERVFGGDSVMAYLGTYAVDRSVIKARVRSWIWNTDVPAEEVANVFGMTGLIDYIAILEGTVEGAVINGELYPEHAPNFRLRAHMEKISELP